MCVPRLNQCTLCSGTFQGGIPHEGNLGGLEGWVSGVCLSCWRRWSGDTGRRTKAGRTEPRWPRQGQRPRAGAGAGEPGSPGQLACWRPAGQTAVPRAGQLCLVQTWGEEPRLPAPETARGCLQSPQESGPRARVAEGTGFPRRPGWRARPSEAPATQPHTVTARSGLCHGACNADTDSFVFFEIKSRTVCFQKGRLS